MVCFCFCFLPSEEARTAVIFSRNKPVYPFCSTGPPMVPKLSAFSFDMGPNGNVTLQCKANQLNAQQMTSYKWKWMFKNGREILDIYGKYKILSSFSPPNSCQQTKGAVYLHVENVTREDLGTYKCVLLESDMEVAVEDVPFYKYGMLSVLNCVYLLNFDGKPKSLSWVQSRKNVTSVAIVLGAKSKINYTSKLHRWEKETGCKTLLDKSLVFFYFNSQHISTRIVWPIPYGPIMRFAVNVIVSVKLFEITWANTELL